MADHDDSPAPPLCQGKQGRTPSCTIGCDRRLGGRLLVLVLLLSWPLLLFGRPAYFPDTAAYYKGGRAAIVSLQSKLIAPAAAPGAGAVPDSAQVRGARSIVYSVSAYLLRGHDAAMVPLVLGQALAVAFAGAVFLTALGVGNRVFLASAMLLAIATPAAWFTSFAMPDIFAGVTILVVGTMAVFGDRLTRPLTIALALTGAFAIAAHPSHIALAIVMLPLAIGWRLWLRRGAQVGEIGGSGLWLAMPLLAGVAVVVIGGMVGFGEVSLAPRRHPLTLGRAIGDGPARWYLEAHCRDRHYAVCELYPAGFPTTTAAFLWGPNGIRHRASAAQMERIRNEEEEILIASAAAYPVHATADMIGGTLRQLVTFRIDEADVNVRALELPGGRLHFIADRHLPDWAIDAADRVIALVLLAAAAGLAVGLIRAPAERRALAALLVAGIVANAAICAILSGVDDRYQARVVWLLPLAALATFASGRRTSPSFKLPPHA